MAAASAVVRTGVETLLSRQDALTVIARSFQPRALADDIDAVHPDVVVLALDVDDGEAADAAGSVLSDSRAPAFVVLRDAATPLWISDALQAGIRAVLPTDVRPDELLAAVAAAAAGLSVVPTAVAAAVISDGGAHSRAGTNGVLTARELEVLQMLAGGLGNKTIAKRLGISTHTVKYHVGSIMTKLSAASRTEAVTVGIRRGLILL